MSLIDKVIRKEHSAKLNDLINEDMMWSLEGIDLEEARREFDEAVLKVETASDIQIVATEEIAETTSHTRINVGFGQPVKGWIE